MSGYTNQSIREDERDSISGFIRDCAADYLTGRVLDYGCGAQPYRSLIEEAGGTYAGYDDPGLPGHVNGEDATPFPIRETGHWDAVLCTQVLQYVPDPGELLGRLRRLLEPSGGFLVMTYPTHWPEVEGEDLWRFTHAGVRHLLRIAGFDVLRHERRHAIHLGGFDLAVGYAVVARA